MKESLPNPESAVTKDLIYKIGYYAVMLDTLELAPDWRKLYQERLEELKEQLDVSLNSD